MDLAKGFLLLIKYETTLNLLPHTEKGYCVFLDISASFHIYT